MVEIPADTYEVGTTTLADEFHSAPTSITLNNFWIDKYQTTNAQYQRYLGETGGQPPEIWPGNSMNQPVRGVTWDQAAAYCTWANKRLPKEAEWEAAGRGPGPNPLEYPWGNDYNKASDLPVKDTYDVGTQAFNKSPLGVFDLVGNVYEWVREPYSSVQEGFQILRGGRFGNAQDLSYRVPIVPNDPVYLKFAGFRCAADQVQ
jgi:formylglycine-generating enzyme required for sulfatase activity